MDDGPPPASSDVPHRPSSWVKSWHDEERRLLSSSRPSPGVDEEEEEEDTTGEDTPRLDLFNRKPTDLERKILLCLDLCTAPQIIPKFFRVRKRKGFSPQSFFYTRILSFFYRNPVNDGGARPETDNRRKSAFLGLSESLKSSPSLFANLRSYRLRMSSLFSSSNIWRKWTGSAKVYTSVADFLASSRFMFFGLVSLPSLEELGLQKEHASKVQVPVSHVTTSRSTVVDRKRSSSSGGEQEMVNILVNELMQPGGVSLARKLERRRHLTEKIQSTALHD